MCKHICLLFSPLLINIFIVILVLIVFISDYKTWIDNLLFTERRRLRKIRKRIEEKERM